MRSASAIASSGTPAARAAAVAAAAFSRLCAPGISGSAGSGSSAENSIPSSPSPRGTIFVAGPLEDAQLRVAVRLEGAVPVEVVRLEVEQDGDVARERRDVLELEARELADDPRARLDLAVELGERAADVAAPRGSVASIAPSSSSVVVLPFVPVTPTSRGPEQPVAELDLAPDRDAPRLAPRPRAATRAGTPGLFDEHVYAVEQAELASRCPQLAVGRDDVHPAPREREHRRLPRAREPETSTRCGSSLSGTR